MKTMETIRDKKQRQQEKYTEIETNVNKKALAKFKEKPYAFKVKEGIKDEYKTENR